MSRTRRTPPTPQVAAARAFAARVRLALAAFAALLLVVDPAIHPHPAAGLAGAVIVALTALGHLRPGSARRHAIEEPLACSAGVLFVTLGPAGLAPLTLVWLVIAALGVLGRGGRASATGRVVVLAVLASPIAIHGVDADTLTLLAAGCALLLGVGRVSNETTELLRDPLTGVLSRGALNAEADRLAAKATPGRELAVVLVDLDDFGVVNKRHGHQAGDELLRRACDAVGASLRRDDVLGRLGGDEFVVLGLGDARTIGDRVLGAVLGAGLSASVGVAAAPRDGTDGLRLLAAADAALRRSKLDGKGRVTVCGEHPPAPEPSPEPAPPALALAAG